MSHIIRSSIITLTQRGLLRLRQAIAKKVGHGIEHDEVIVTSGGRFAIFSAILSILRPGEEVISIEPSWPAYREFVDFAGGKIKTWALQ